MSQSNRRTQNFQMNKYQRRIIALAFFPTVVLCLTILVIAKFFYKELIDIITNSSTATSVRFIDEWGALTIFIVWCLFVLILAWGYLVSRDMVGAFVRILRELDEIIEGGERKRITVRQNDDLASELLNRINLLIDNLPREKGKLLPRK